MDDGFCYYYKAEVLRVVDGDSIRCDVDMGFGIWQHNKDIRLYGINAPEIRTTDLEEKERGYVSKDWLDEIIEDVDYQVILKTYKDSTGKYGRLLADVLVVIDGELVNINQRMLSEGLAEIYE